MVEFIKDLVFHFSIIMSLGFMYNFLNVQKVGNYQAYFFKFSVFLVLLLTMAFPVKFNGGVEFDLKLIPVFIAFFYISRKDGLLILVLMLLIQGVLDSKEVAVMAGNYLAVLLLFYIVGKLYHEATLFKKIVLGLAVYLLITATRLASLLHSENGQEYLLYLLVFSIMSFISLAITIYIIEVTNFQLKTMHELHKAEKFSAISQLAASVAHEIRNPMTTIRGFMQVLQGEKNLNDDQNLFISISLQELDRTQVIINNFLALAKPNTNSRSQFDLSALLGEITDFMRSYSHLSNTELIEEIQPSLSIKGDPQEIRQVFINIIKNGIEAMPDGGSFYINAFHDRDSIKVQFKDEGIGMTKAQLTRLGNPYYSTKEKGTGLGLMISYDIIQRMKGKITVESELGTGTIFTIQFPV